jgi:2-C-methyl-D-erythritol 4-phosphate cytidylyltransferase
VDRSELVTVQTPQGFRRDLLVAAHRCGDDPVTDDAGLVERLGEAVVTVAGAVQAFKVTTPADLAMAAAMLAGWG